MFVMSCFMNVILCFLYIYVSFFLFSYKEETTPGMYSNIFYLSIYLFLLDNM